MVVVGNTGVGTSTVCDDGIGILRVIMMVG